MNNLNIAGLSLALEPTPAGSILSTEVLNFAVKTLAWVVNIIVTSVNEEQFAKVVSTLERGEEYISQGWCIGRPDDPDTLGDYTQAKEAWQELTGSPPGEDSYILSMCFIPEEIIIPRKVLLEIIYALRKLRQQEVSVGEVS